jgi:hypothetical protein
MDKFKLISCRVYKSPLWNHNVHQIDPVHIHRRQFFQIYFNITLPRKPKSKTCLPFWVFFNTIMCVFLSCSVGVTSRALLIRLYLITSNNMQRATKMHGKQYWERNCCYRILLPTLLETEDIEIFASK